MEKNKVIICVPVYKQFLSTSEKASFKQLIKILKNYDITLATYKTLDLKEYIAISRSKEFSVTYFDQTYFKDTDTYSKLLLSPRFYKAFKNYKFLLIYQLDAWVFRDELQYWCSMDFDYIGAPWFSNHNKKEELETFYGVGNGGFSLRKISSHLKALNHFYRLNSIKIVFNDFLNNRKGYTSFKNLFYNLTFRNYSHKLLTPNIIINEDIFWGLIAKRKFNWYSVPDMMTAGKFSFEINASLLFEANSEMLPFGCHAWEVYDPKFWEKFIKV